MHKSATKCNETIGKRCKNKHGASKIIDTLETYQPAFSCRPKGDQPAPGCRLGVEEPKGGEIKEKVEGTGLRQASKWLMIMVFSA
jgi:hypothetical protein